jgi:lipoprotein-anchoring transpeptidase ErfK/SrfK
LGANGSFSASGGRSAGPTSEGSTHHAIAVPSVEKSRRCPPTTRQRLFTFSTRNCRYDSSLGQTAELWQAVTNGAPDDLFTHYTITEDDVRGPFLQKLPRKMEAMKDLPGLYYTRPREELAERFHVSEDLLAALNPRVKFDTAGESLVVPAVTDNPLKAQVAQIIVDKSAQALKAFNAQKQLLAFYPATVGSEEKPAPSGRLKVTIIKRDPAYHYNPKYHFKGVKTRKPFTIKPGPNNPVGLVWIGLSGEGYGIHGTPDPDKVSKTESHGCVRLTNWDALQLAAAASKGIPVDFVGED